MQKRLNTKDDLIAGGIEDVSSDGKTIIVNGKKRTPVVLKTTKTRSFIGIVINKNKKIKFITLARANGIGNAGPLADNLDVIHVDGDYKNNDLSNLGAKQRSHWMSEQRHAEYVPYIRKGLTIVDCEKKLQLLDEVIKKLLKDKKSGIFDEEGINKKLQNKRCQGSHGKRRLDIILEKLTKYELITNDFDGR